ncbi:MAG: hypothetical protein LUH63_09990 [Parabacteroides sp.]|nr:hypothetical protein [Parabacteroides sp.]
MMTLNKMQRCFCILTGIIIAAYVVIVCFLAKNIPYFDDYGALLRDTLDFFTTESAFDRLGVLFSRTGEHRLFFTHIVPVLTALFIGKVNLSLVLFIVFILSLSIFYWYLSSVIKTVGAIYYFPHLCYCLVAVIWKLSFGL